MSNRKQNRRQQMSNEVKAPQVEETTPVVEELVEEITSEEVDVEAIPEVELVEEVEEIIEEPQVDTQEVPEETNESESGEDEEVIEEIPTQPAKEKNVLYLFNDLIDSYMKYRAEAKVIDSEVCIGHINRIFTFVLRNPNDTEVLNRCFSWVKEQRNKLLHPASALQGIQYLPKNDARRLPVIYNLFYLTTDSLGASIDYDRVSAELPKAENLILFIKGKNRKR